MSTLSLFKELTWLKDPKYPVTEILTQLITLIGHDVCLTKRNHYSVYLALSQARDVCNNINDLIGKAKLWTEVETYMKMILGIEQILLDFSALAEKESVESRFPGKPTVQEDIAFINTWRVNRETLAQIFRDLYKSEYFGATAVAQAKNVGAIHKQDDLGLLKAINLRLQTTASAKSNPNLAAIISKFGNIENTSTDAPDHIFVYSIHFAMAIDILVSGRHPKLTARLQDSSLWALAQRGVDLLAQTTTPKTTLETAWTDFCTSLNGGATGNTLVTPAAVTMPDAYNHIRTLLAQIKRPYRSQSTQLVSGCEQLATKFNEKAKTTETYNALKTALEDTKKALEAAKTVTYDPAQNFNFASNSAGSSFTTAEKSVKDCFKAYQVHSVPPLTAIAFISENTDAGPNLR
ncbi:hypothetical protein B0H12DRAFT_164194 [Mycena haematopus]|nr:hypothetical protein B0H12DRAFT_164194 [Mycena haematopus]